MKTNEYLDEIKARHGIASDYALAKLIGCARSGISGYRAGKSTFDDSTAARVAELLDRDPEEVMIASHAERAKDERTRALWARLARKAGYAASAALFCAAQLQANGGTIDIMSTRRRRPGFRDDEQSCIQSNEQARNMRVFFRVPH